MTDVQAIRAAYELASETHARVEDDSAKRWKKAALSDEEHRPALVKLARDVEEDGRELYALTAQLADMLSRIPEVLRAD